MKSVSVNIFSKWIILLLLLVTAGQAHSQSPDLSTAHGYLQYITSEFSTIQKDSWDYTRAVAKNKSARKVESRRKELIGTINTAIARVRKLKGFEKDNALRDTCISFMEINKAVIDRDYARIMELEEIKEASYDNMEAYLAAQQKADEILQAAGENVEAQEKLFAANHNITLVESQDKISKKLAQSSRVYEYYNKVYLLFFKSYKQEAYLLDATAKKDVNAMEQNKNNLLKYAKEGLDQMKGMGVFDGDGSLKLACVQMLTFYKEEAEKNYQVYIDFQLKQDNFNKIKAAMDAKSASSRTKEDVDAFNKAVNDFNQAVNELNQKNKSLNDARAKLLNNWNSTAEKFTSSHVG